MTRSQKRQLRFAIAELLTGIGGFWLLWYSTNWQFTLAVFLLWTSHNFKRASEEERRGAWD